jgi:TP901 family phage tail tape measure protein
MPIKIPTVQTGLEASIQAAAKKAGRNLKINMGGNAKSIEGLSQPLGRITGKADQFTKSMEAANARVLAFGASVGILSAVTRGFKELIKVTIDVEKSLTSINSILNVSTRQLESFKNTIFDVARNTEQSFSTVAQAALELSRQGLKAEEVTSRLNDALILSRLSGLGASEAVAGLTAAINSFNKAGLSSSQVLNKLSAAAVSAAVSEKDLIEGIKRSGSVATQAGVSFDELVGVITAVQAKTARGGAVIGNSFKTIFTRIQSIDKLKTMQNLGVEVTDASGQVLGATKLIQNLAKSLEDVPDARRLQIAEGLVGKFQVAPFLAILDDYISKTSRAIAITEVSQNATSQAYDRNEAQNATLSAAINRTTQSVAQFAEALGKIGVTDNLKSLLGFFSSVIEDITGLFDGDSLGAKFAKGIVAGIGNIITGPGLAVFIAIIGKLAIDLVRFGAGSLKTFFGLNKAAQQQATLQGQIASTLLSNSGIQKQILAIENSTLSVGQKRAAQTAFFTTALNEQLLVMTRMQSIASRIAPGVMRGTSGGGRAAGGFIPNYNAIVGYGSEKSDISKGVGGAPTSARPVTIPNFNFGGGQKGSMVANSSEYIVPNYAGGDGSAIFNQDMAASIGLPSGARKIGAAGGYIPNFVNEDKALVMFVGTRGEGQHRDFFVGKKGKTTMAYSNRAAAEKAKLNQDSIKPVHVPVYKLKQKDGEKKPLSIKKIRKKLSKSSTKTAMEFAKSLAPKSDIPNVSKAKLKTLFNPGAFEGMSGSIFEVALSGVLASTQFKDYSTRTSNSRIDLPYDQGLFDMFGVPAGKGQMGGEVKATSPLAKAAAIKFYDIRHGGALTARYQKKVQVYDKNGKAIKGKFENTALGATMTKSKFDSLYPNGINGMKTVNGVNSFLQKKNSQMGSQSGTVGDFKNLFDSRPRSAGGYIPNFANPLQDAIGREQAAGLPVNQIRVNQSPRLRNAGNPMGLAVTNTRDEPTGAIPNFAKPAGPAQANDAMGGFIGKLFAIQIGMSMLSGVLGEVTEKNKAVAASMTLLNVAVSGMMLGQAFGGLKGVMGFLGGSKGKGLFKAGRTQIAQGATTFSGTVGKFSTMGGGNKMKGALQVALGGMRAFGGGLLAVVGPLALIATAAWGINKALDWWSGRSELAAMNTEELGKSAERTREKLDAIEIPDAVRKRVREQAETRADFRSSNMSGRDSGNTMGASEDVGFFGGLVSILKNKNINWGGNIKGSDAVPMENYNKVIKEAGDRGIDPIFINRLEKNMKEDFDNRKATIGEKVIGKRFDPQKELGVFMDSLQNAIKSFEPQEEIDKTVGRLTKEQISIIKQSATNERDALSGKRKLTADELIQRQTSDKMILKGRDPRDPTKAQLQPTILIEAIKQMVLQSNTPNQKINKVRGDQAKVELNTEIAIMKIKAKTLTGDERALAFAKRHNSLNGVGVLLLKNKIDLAKEDMAANSKIADIIKQQVDANTELVLDDDKISALTKEIAKTSLKELSTTEGRNKILKETLTTLGVSVKMQEAMKGFLDATIAGIVKEKNERKKVLETTQKQAVLDAERAEFIQNIARDMSRAAFQDKTFNAANTGDSQRDLDKDKNTFDKENMFANSVQKAKAAEGFIRRQAGINIKEKEDEVIASTKAAIMSLTANDALPFFTDQITELAKSIKSVEDIGGIRSFFDKIDDKATVSDAVLKNGIDVSTSAPSSRWSPSGGFAGMKDLIPSLTGGVTAGGKDQSAKIYDAIIRKISELNSAKDDEDLNIDNAGRAIDIAMGGSLSDKFKNAFDFEEYEIQQSLDDSLVQSARDFTDTISNGLVNAIAKGEDLGDVLRQAASNFFLGEAQSNMSAAFKNITSNFFASGGPVTGGSGSKDDVPALLMGGEFVMRKSAVQKYGSSFMDSLNSGKTPAMARGGLFTPGTYGQEEIPGKNNLLDFATQSFTAGNSDRFGSGSGFASVDLEPQSAALTMFGRRNSPAFQREQASKQKAFGLFSQQVNKEEQAKEQKKKDKKAFWDSLGAAAAATGFKSLTDLFGPKADLSKASQGLDITKTRFTSQRPTFPSSGSSLKATASTWNPLEGLDLVDLTSKTELKDFGASNDFRSAGWSGLPEKKATGGAIPNAAGVDTVPSMLSGGEFVMNAAATQKIGAGNLNALNSGASGGSEDVVSKLDELISVSDNAGETVINITVNSDGSSDSQGNGDDQQTSLATKIKDVVKQVIDDEKRLGGSLRQARA